MKLIKLRTENDGQQPVPAAGAARRRIRGVGFDENPSWPVAGRTLGGCCMPRDARAYLSEINGR